MKIGKNISMLEVPIGPGGIIHPTLLWDDVNMVLLDTGMPGSFQRIHDAIEKEGQAFNRLNKIIITHQDLDHTGGVMEILEHSKKNIEVFAHTDDTPYINGEKKLVRFNPKFMNALPPERREFMEATFNSYTPIKVNETLTDNQLLPFCGGLTVIHTPGHTPGHICIYHQESKTLIAGDGLNIQDGQLFGPRKEILDDEAYQQATDSLNKLVKFHIERVITYHGGVYNHNPDSRIKELL